MMAVLTQVHSAVTQPPVAVTGAVVFADPWHPPIPDGVVVLADDKVLAVGPAAAVRIPRGARMVRCDGCAAMAGFWNLHVHFTEPAWLGADTAKAERLTATALRSTSPRSASLKSGPLPKRPTRSGPGWPLVPTSSKSSPGLRWPATE
jgi:hypothetical protein